LGAVAGQVALTQDFRAPENSTATSVMRDESSILSAGCSQAVPRATFLLCTNRSDPLLDRAILSCLKQTEQDFEILIVTNGANAHAIASELKSRFGHEVRVRIFSTEVRHLNFSLALGLHLARAPLVARIDADDVSAADRLALQIAFMHAHPDVGVLATGYELIDADGSVLSRVIPPTSDEAIRRQFYYRNPVCHPSVMIRVSAIRQIGGYLGGHHAEDYDLWCRLLVDGKWRISAIPQPLMRYNSDPTGLARRSRSAYVSMASTQVACLLMSKDPRWLLGVLVSIWKLLVRSKR